MYVGMYVCMYVCTGAHDRSGGVVAQATARLFQNIIAGPAVGTPLGPTWRTMGVCSLASYIPPSLNDDGNGT